MNRRYAILSTVLGWVGLSDVPSSSEASNLVATQASAGIEFHPDVTSYEMKSKPSFLENGKTLRRIFGSLTFSFERGPHPSDGKLYLTREGPFVKVPLRNGYKRQSSTISIDVWNRSATFEFIDEEI